MAAWLSLLRLSDLSLIIEASVDDARTAAGRYLMKPPMPEIPLLTVLINNPVRVDAKGERASPDAP